MLGVGGLIVSGGLAILALRATAGAVKLALGTTLLLVGSGVAAYEVKKAQRALASPGQIA